MCSTLRQPHRATGATRHTTALPITHPPRHCRGPWGWDVLAHTQAHVWGRRLCVLRVPSTRMLNTFKAPTGDCTHWLTATPAAARAVTNRQSVVGQALGWEKMGPGPVTSMLPLWALRCALGSHPSVREMPWPPRAPGLWVGDKWVCVHPLCLTPLSQRLRGPPSQHVRVPGASLCLCSQGGDRVSCVGA